MEIEIVLLNNDDQNVKLGGVGKNGHNIINRLHRYKNN